MTPMRSRIQVAVAAAVLSAVLAGCQSTEERAERHFQSALELVAEEDVERALVEFRNVFENNPRHREARLAYAKLLDDEGRPADSFRHFTIAAEQYPDDLQARIELASIGAELGLWDEVDRHLAKAQQLDASNARVQVLLAVSGYRTAIEDDDATARREAADQLRQLRASVDETRLADQLLIDSLLRDGELSAALDEINARLTDQPEDERLQQLKLQVLARLGDDDGIRQQLETLVDLFPENETYASNLIQWFTSRGEIDEAEAFIRTRVAENADDETQRAFLIAFLRQTRGNDAALAEIEAALESETNPDLFRSLRAGLLFDEGEREKAIAEMEDIVEAAEPSEQTNGIKVALARMHLAMGNEVAARQRVEEVLAADPSNVEAIKMSATWLIDDDKTDEAIVVLRTALDQAPSDPQIMTLLARAHLRNGSRDLAREMLSLAVEASGNAPEQSLDYARFLVGEESYDTAEAVLIDSLRVVPNNLPILSLLGRVYVEQQDWARAEQVEGTLRRLGTGEGEAAANEIQVARLQAQNRGDEALQVLQGLAEEGGDNAATVSIVRTRVAEGDIDGAEEYVDELLAERPDDVQLKLLRAGVLHAAGRVDEAEAVYRDVLETDQTLEGVWRALYMTKLRQGDADSAAAVLDEALAILPEAPNLLWAKAGQLERDGDVEGAIALYEGLYDEMSESPVVANNLASLIATYREGDEDLERAYRIARRLRGAEIPAFQDTYGWIAFRRGDIDEALAHLEPAAEGLPDDPVVQYHLARAYAGAERYEEALAQYRRALDVAGPADTRPQFDTAREEIERIEGILEGQGQN